MERFIRPAQSRWSDKMSTTSLTYASLIFLRWILLLTFVTTTVWSSLYIIELASFSIREQRFAFTGPLIILAVLMACQLCCAVSFLLTILIEQVIPRGKLQDFLLTQVNKQTERIMKKVMSNLYGTDRKDTEGGEVTVSRNADVLARLDRLENLLHQVIAKQARKEDEELEVHFNDVPLVFLPETDELDLGAVKG